MAMWPQWIFVVTGWSFTILGLAMAAWAIVWDRPRGRRRCPKCWYNMTASPTVRCSECGHVARREKHLLRTRRKWRWFVAAAVPIAVGYAVSVAPRVQQVGWSGAVPTTILIWWVTRPEPDADWDDQIRTMSAPSQLTLELARRARNGQPWDWQRRWMLTRAAQQRLERAMKRLAAVNTTQERFYALNDAAKESFVVGNVEDAQKYAHELMTLLPKFQENWNYGNAVQDANLVLGRIAVREGRVDDAKRYLIEAGKSPGSPQMNSFGPNMSLAKDLLEKGEPEIVLEYFELCRKFWDLRFQQLDKWSQQVKDGKIPDFGANLVY